MMIAMMMITIISNATMSATAYRDNRHNAPAAKEKTSNQGNCAYFQSHFLDLVAVARKHACLCPLAGVSACHGLALATDSIASDSRPHY
jgi:hypothetical protein